MENTDLKGGSPGLQQTTTATAEPQQIVLVQQSHGNTSPNLAVGSCRGLGIGQLVCGIVLIAVAIILISLGSEAEFVSFMSVVVFAILFIITGSLGIGSARTKNRCLIHATLVLSILSSLGGLGILPGAIVDLNLAAKEWPAWTAAYAIILVVSVTEVILAIKQTMVCCRAVCCGYQQQPLQAVYYYTQPYAQNQPMVPTEQPYMANQPMAQTGQVACAPNQPMAATGQYYPQNPPAAPGGEKGYTKMTFTRERLVQIL
ncbi:membrane-spanning 4-domains subfamily A member 4D-like isoform X2 [Ptychodera flava]